MIDTFLLSNTYNAENVEIAMSFDYLMLLFACWHLACLRQMQNRTRESLAGRQLLPDSGADNASLAKGLTMLLKDSIQIKHQGCGKAHHAFPRLLRACGEDQDAGRSAVASTRTALALPQTNGAITHLREAGY